MIIAEQTAKINCPNKEQMDKGLILFEQAGYTILSIDAVNYNFIASVVVQQEDF